MLKGHFSFNITSIRMRLLLIVLLIMLVSFSVLIGVGYYFSKQALSQSVDETVTAIGTDYAHRVEASTNEIVIFVQELANNSNILSGNDREQIVKALAEGMKRSDKFTGLNYGDLNGYVLRAQGDIYYLGDREYYQKAVRTKKTAISDPLISKGSGRISLAIAVPVIVNGDLKGILQATVPLDSLNDLVKDVKFKDSGYGMIVAKSGVIISDAQHPELNGMLNLSEKEIKPDLNLGITELDYNLTTLFKMTVESGKQMKGIHTFLSKDKPLLSVFTPIDLPGDQRWVMIITAPEAEVTREGWTLSLIFMVVSLVCILLGAGAVVVFSAKFAQPIQIIRDDCMMLARGDLREPERKIFSHDEIGQLAQGFGQMRVNLRNMMQELEFKNASLEQEIVQRKEAQQILAVSEEKFNKAFRCSSEAIALVRLRDRRYIEINDAFVNVLGYSHQEVIHHTSSEFDLWVDAEERARVHQAIDVTGTVRNLEVHWRYKSGEIRVGRYSADVIIVEGDKCVLLSWHDITDIKNAERLLRQDNEQLESKVVQRTQELTAMNQELQAVNDELNYMLVTIKKTQEQLVQSEKMASLGSLVAGIAHEVNTPLGIGVTAISHLQQLTKEIIVAYESKTLKAQALADFFADCLEAVEMVSLNLHRAAGLIKSFKQVSIDQSSEVQRSFNIKSYLDEVLLSLRPQLKKTNLTIEVCCDEKLQIDSLPGVFSQIISNLVMNSLMHAYESGDTGKITINIWKDQEWLYMIYADDGKGIEPELLNKIFDPFFTTKRGTGSGLGLYILYNIIRQRLGGTIECRSQLGQGATFSICWPL